MLSFEDRQQKIRAALEQKFPRREGQYEAGPWLVATFDVEAIVQRDGKLWRLPYTLTDGQDVTLGELQLVEVAYESVSEAVAFSKALDKTGASWDVRVLKFGVSRHGYLWTRESGEALLPHLTKAPIGLYALANGFMEHAAEAAIATAGGALVRNIVGDVGEPRLEADGVYARAHIHEGDGRLRKQLLEFAERGLLEKAIGLSIDCFTGFVPVQVREGMAKWIRKIERVFSLDIVTAPSADGRFIRAMEAQSLFTTPKEDVMTRSQLIKLAEARPDLLKGRTAEALTDQELEAVVQEGMKPPTAAAPPAPATEPELKKEIDELKRVNAVSNTQARVSEALAATQLPQPIKDKVAKQFVGRVAEATEIAAVVKDEVDAYAKLVPAPAIPGGGSGRVLLGPEVRDKVGVAMDRLFGVNPERFGRALEAMPMSAASLGRVREALSPNHEAHKDRGLDFGGSLRRAYVELTGDVDVTGFMPEGRVAEAITTATWANILANSLYRRLLQDYAAVNYNERTIAQFGRAADFRTRDTDHLNYFADLQVFDPEAQDYPAIAEPGDGKVSYAVDGRGGVLTITRRTIINDDLGAVDRMMTRLGRAARRTLARFIWNFWVANSVFDVDGLAWFHATHANTGATALTANLAGATEVLAKIIQLADMTEPGSAEKLGLPALDSLWLDVPHALYGVAMQINDSLEFGAGNVNPVYKRFGQSGERINTNALFTDATDWGVHVAPGAGGREGVQVDFLNGREEPEFFVANQPTVGQTFVADKLQMKIRHEYGGDIQDFRGATKNVVA